MTPRPQDLPPHLAAAAFHVRDARRVGLSYTALRHARFAAPHRGVRLLLESDVERPRSLRATVVRMAQNYRPLQRPQEAFSHTTALVLLGAPIRCVADLHLVIPLPSGAARGRGVRGHTASSSVPVVATPEGLVCVDAAVALAQCGMLLPFRELVVALEHFICPRGPAGARRAAFTIEHLRAVSDRVSRAGARRLRAAFTVARVGAESRMESLTHLELARIGHDTLDLQGVVRDAQGRWIGRFDQVDHVRRRIIEYDGEQHRVDRRQYLKDLERLDRVRDAGYRVLRVHAEDLARAQRRRTRERICAFLEVEPRPLPARLARYFAEDE